MDSHEHSQLVEEGLRLFNEQKYWECHEVFEELWLEDRQDPVRNIYWAIIQIAASCIHYRDSNLIGARGMMAKAKEKLLKCRELHLLNHELVLSLNWSELEEAVEKIPVGTDSSLEDFKKIFDFRFIVIKKG